MDSSKTKLRSEISFFNIKFQEFCLENLINFANIFFLRRIIDQFLKFLKNNERNYFAMVLKNGSQPKERR